MTAQVPVLNDMHPSLVCSNGKRVEKASRMDGKALPAALSKAPPSLKFPSKLYRILSNPKFNDIICWLPHGKSWRVLQQERFEKEVLPLFFRHGRHASFIRQVNGWGFRRIQSGPDYNSYYHESFVRDSPESCRRMRRPTAEELEDRKNCDHDSPPNFYKLFTPLESKEKEAVNDSFSAPTKDQSNYKADLIKRLLICSSEEKLALLNFELAKLADQKKSISKQLQMLELLNTKVPKNAHKAQPYKVASMAIQAPLHPLMHVRGFNYLQMRQQMLLLPSMMG